MPRKGKSKQEKELKRLDRLFWTFVVVMAVLYLFAPRSFIVMIMYFVSTISLSYVIGKLKESIRGGR